MRKFFVASLVLMCLAIVPGVALGAKAGGRISCTDEYGFDSRGMTVTGLDRIANGRDEIDVRLGSDDSAPEGYTITITDSSGAIVAAKAGSGEAASYGNTMVVITGVPTTGDLNVSVTASDPGYACTNVAWSIKRFAGTNGIAWKKYKILNNYADGGYALGAYDPKGLFSDLIGTPIVVACQELSVGPVVATIAASGGVGTKTTTARFADQCDLAAGHIRGKARPVLGAKATMTPYGYSLNIVYPQAASETYKMTAKVAASTSPSLTRRTRFVPEYRVWEGTDEYFNYCIGNLFDVNIVMQNGRRYCTHPEVRTL